MTAVVSLGQLADTAYQAWAATQPDAAAQLHHAPLRHPTYPESASRAGDKTLAETTAVLLADWNEHLPALRDHVMPDQMSQTRLYGTGWQDGDLVPFPHADLPPGSPPWWTLAESVGRPHRHHRPAEAGDDHRHRPHRRPRLATTRPLNDTAAIMPDRSRAPVGCQKSGLGR